MRIRPLALALAALTVSACGGGDATTTEPTPEAPAVATPAAPALAAEATAAPYDGPPAEVTIQPVGNEMRYDTEAFTVAPGQEVHLRLTNVATNEAMRHNVVVLRAGADAAAFGQAAMTAADTDYIPAARAGDVLAHTPMSEPGQTVEVTFTAPAVPGAYPFLCTFPGHLMTMRGTMQVVAQPA